MGGIVPDEDLVPDEGLIGRPVPRGEARLARARLAALANSKLGLTELPGQHGGDDRLECFAAASTLAELACDLSRMEDVQMIAKIARHFLNRGIAAMGGEVETGDLEEEAGGD